MPYLDLKTYEVLKQDQRLIGTSDLSGLRESAMTRLEGRGFPGRKTEEWRYTNTAPLLQEHYVTPKKNGHLICLIRHWPK